MNVINQEEYNTFPVVNGYKQCPSGNYTQIKYFGERCTFDDNCIFGNDCNFGESNKFGEHCTFGEYCDFGEHCSFGNSCSFKEGCRFDVCCEFGIDCKFMNKCRFEHGHLSKNGYPLLIFGGFGIPDKTTYFFNCAEGILVRCGDFFGNIEQFKKMVKENKTDTIAKEYLMIADLVEMKWK